MRLIDALRNKKTLLAVPVVAFGLTVGVVAAQDKPEPKAVTITASGNKAPEQEAPVVDNTNTASAPVQLSTSKSASPRVASASVQNQEVAAISEPVEEQTPPRVRTNKATRYEEVGAYAHLITSPAPDGYKYMEQYCDYSYSDGTLESTFLRIATRKLPGSAGVEINVNC